MSAERVGPTTPTPPSRLGSRRVRGQLLISSPKHDMLQVAKELSNLFGALANFSVDGELHGDRALRLAYQR